MLIRRLAPPDSTALQALRLAALRDVPSAFHASYDEEKDLPISATEEQLKIATDRGVFGAFEDAVLVGIVALGRQGMRKLQHKAFVWSMYVIPQFRGKGAGRALLLEALTLARSVRGLLQVNLGVNASNVPAIRLYESVGFKVFGREPGALLIDGVLHDELHMLLRIDES
ncbi:MAG: GNAT family N-acetyltransferase [Burkholderiales bacterium]